jgi:hypothetical protein
MTAIPAVAASDAGSWTGTGAPTAWGPHYSPGATHAKALGTMIATGEDHEVIPSAATLTVSGKMTLPGADLEHVEGVSPWDRPRRSPRRGM